MGDYIDREELLTHQYNASHSNWPQLAEMVVGVEDIEDAPAADVAPVVRCKECKYSYADLNGLCCAYGVCVDSNVPEDFYCANGERRGGGEDG